MMTASDSVQSQPLLQRHCSSRFQHLALRLLSMVWILVWRPSVLPRRWRPRAGLLHLVDLMVILVVWVPMLRLHRALPLPPRPLLTRALRIASVLMRLRRRR